MSSHFKNKLIDLYDSDVGVSRFGRGASEEELKQMIRYGSWGEVGDNYYLFIYRDFLRDSAYYGAVVFLDTTDELGRPVRVRGVELNGKQQIRNIYVKAALFYLKNGFQPTMAISGGARDVFESAREMLADHIVPASIRAAAKGLEAFNVDFIHREVDFKVVRVKSSSRVSETRGLNESLEKLTVGQKEQETATPTLQAAALPALNLKAQVLDLSGDKRYFFQPLIRPLRSDGTFGRVRKFSAGEANRTCLVLEYPQDEAFLPLPEELEDFFRQYVYIDSLKGHPGFKIKMLQHVFFDSMAEVMFRMPDSLSFFQDENQRLDYKKLHKLEFSRVTVRFAPSLLPRRDHLLTFYLNFTDCDGRTREAKDNFEIILTQLGGVFVLFTDPDDRSWLARPAVNEAPEVHRFFRFLEELEDFQRSELPAVIEALLKLDSEVIDVVPVPLQKYQLSVLPYPVLNIYPSDEELKLPDHLTISFDYLEPIGKFIAAHPDKLVFTYQPDEVFEARCRELLSLDPLLSRQMDVGSGNKKMFHYFGFNSGEPLQWLGERGMQYMDRGFKIYSVRWKRFIGRTGAGILVKMEHGIDWLEFKPMLIHPESGAELEIDLENTDTENFDRDGGAVVDKDGMLHLLTKKELEKLLKLYRFARRQGNRFVVPSKNYILIKLLYDKRMDEIPTLNEILGTPKRLEKFNKIEDRLPACSFNGELRGYQQEGFKWLQFLRDYGFSGCLADDMGLGKTVQTLALLETLKCGGTLKTSLLVVPVSAIPNWEAELRKFAPSLSFLRHIGTGRARETTGWECFDVIISSYATVRNDVALFKDFGLDYLILDESQNIKNAASQTAQAVKVLQSNNRLALSGTPIENNSIELWSLFDFLMPGFLGTPGWFSAHFAQPIERENDTGRAELLKSMIFPFILRRRKEEVEDQLPEKIQIVSRLPMNDEQAILYKKTAAFYRSELDEQIEEKGVGGSSIKILEGMLRLRQICLFPQLADSTQTDVPSAKLDHLKELLEDILTEDHKVLIFSQFVQALHIIRDHLEADKLGYAYLDGSTSLKDRELNIARFQEDEETRVFLLSLKAGGVALNLTAADYVIIFDPWWNPAVEAQAIDRSHRIGQSRKVMVYRMVMEDSIEEKMLLLQDQKRDLVDQLISSDSLSFKDLKKDDIMKLFA